MQLVRNTMCPGRGIYSRWGEGSHPPSKTTPRRWFNPRPNDQANENNNKINNHTIRTTTTHEGSCDPRELSFSQCYISIHCIISHHIIPLHLPPPLPLLLIVAFAVEITYWKEGIKWVLRRCVSSIYWECVVGIGRIMHRWVLRCIERVWYE